MSAEAIAAAIGTVGNIAGSIVSNKMNLKQNKDFFDYTLPKNQQAQYDMIRNSPELLVEGYKRAGLNPAGISSTYEGGGAQGETVGPTQPVNLDPVGTYMQMKQLEMNEDINAANVRKAEAEAANVEKQNEWFDRLSQQNINLQKAQEDLLQNQSAEVQQMLPQKVDQIGKEIDLLNQQVNYQKLQNDAMESEYEIDGKMVKGKDIPNFKAVFDLEMAKKTLDVDWFKAHTDRLALDRDWMAVLTKEWFAPLIRDLKGDVLNLSPKIKSEVQQTISDIEATLDGIEQFKGEVKKASRFMNDPYGSVKDEFKKFTAPYRKRVKDAWNGNQDFDTFWNSYKKGRFSDK